MTLQPDNNIRLANPDTISSTGTGSEENCLGKD
jgi:hypothetical protein